MVSSRKMIPWLVPRAEKNPGSDSGVTCRGRSQKESAYVICIDVERLSTEFQALIYHDGHSASDRAITLGRKHVRAARKPPYTTANLGCGIRVFLCPPPPDGEGSGVLW